MALMRSLIRAYAHGDLAQVYPLARGTAPSIVALIGALFLGEAVGAAKGLAVVAIALGVVVMSRGSGADLGRMVDFKARGLSLAPELAVGDGALGFCRALEEVFPTTRHQRSGSTRC